MRGDEVFPILGKPATSVEPSNGALDNPTAWQHHKPFGDKIPDNFTLQIASAGATVPMPGRLAVRRRDGSNLHLNIAAQYRSWRTAVPVPVQSLSWISRAHRGCRKAS